MMLYNERAELILQQLQLQSTVKVTELSQLLQVFGGHCPPQT